MFVNDIFFLNLHYPNSKKKIHHKTFLHEHIAQEENESIMKQKSISNTGLAFACLLVFNLFALHGICNAADIKPKVRYHEGRKVVESTTFNALNSSSVTDAKGCQWSLKSVKKKVAADNMATDYTLTWKLKKGLATNVSFSVDFEMDDWSPENYVFVPAIVYDGNRFEAKKIDYPPFWYDKSEWRLDMPTTFAAHNPSLGKVGSPSKPIQLISGNASTPLMAYFSNKNHKVWMVQTNQGNTLGYYGMNIEENADRSKATFSITAPVVRLSEEEDSAVTVKEGESISISFRVYDFKAQTKNDMMNRFVDVRKDFNKSERNDVVPYSQVWTLLNNLYQTRRWDDRINMYWLSDVQEEATWNFIWQLGWVGGGQATFPIMILGSEEEKDRAKKNLDAIYDRCQTKSGFYYGYGDGKEFKGFGYYLPLENNIAFVRSQGDWLYLSQLQMNYLEAQGEKVKDTWKEGTRKQADAFVRLWEKYGQFGQFIDVESGDICIGNSCAAAIVPAGLALASKLYGNQHYLDVAKAGARWFYNNYVRKGYTTGGPGEILSAPDSESAFGLFESFMALHDITGDKEWLTYANELLPICISWTVSYDFDFPATSPMGKAKAHSTGSVWASVANKHSAPGICTWSGNSLLKYYRSTGDKRALELLEDIAHGLPQYVCRKECQIGEMPIGGICERVNLSDWEGKDNIGGQIFGSCSWTEVAAMLTVAQIPGIYVLTDKQQVTVFDNVKVETVKAADGKMVLKVTNPTIYPADVKIFAETSAAAQTTLLPVSVNGMQTVHLEAGETKEVNI